MGGDGAPEEGVEGEDGAAEPPEEEVGEGLQHERLHVGQPVEVGLQQPGGHRLALLEVPEGRREKKAAITYSYRRKTFYLRGNIV